jgi:hypothetical protein
MPLLNLSASLPLLDLSASGGRLTNNQQNLLFPFRNFCYKQISFTFLPLGYAII